MCISMLRSNYLADCHRSHMICKDVAVVDINFMKRGPEHKLGFHIPLNRQSHIGAEAQQCHL